MKTILFPTDFSSVSDNALNYAASIAQIFNARLILLYAVRSFADRDKFISPAAFDNEAEATQALQKLSEKFSSSISCEYMVKTGVISDEIASAAKESQTDLLIMGTSGAAEVPDALALLNSTTVELIEKKVCPVLAVPAQATIKSIKKIVLAIDKEPLESATLDPLVILSKATRAEVLMVTVSERDTSGVPPTNQTLTKALAGLTYTEHTLTGDNVIESIQDFAYTQAADLVTVIARNRGFFDLLFHDSISQKLALHSRIPLLVLPE